MVMAKRLDFYALDWHSLTLATQKRLVEQYGLHAVSKYGDTFWTEALSTPRKQGLKLAQWLVEQQGQSIDEVTKRGTGLHVAAANGNLEAVDWLLANGARIDRRVSGQTPLEAAVAYVENVELTRNVKVAERLVSAGAKITPAVKKAALRVFSNVDYARDRMNPRFFKQCDAAARALCKLARVEAPAPRRLHDGKTPIVVPRAPRAKQWSALWYLLVPSEGAAKTVQGELVRIAGRINHELFDNGGINWDAPYRKMAAAFPRYLELGKRIDPRSLERVNAFVKALDAKRPAADDAEALVDAALAWVKQNPKPIALGRVAYRR